MNNLYKRPFFAVSLIVVLGLTFLGCAGNDDGSAPLANPVAEKGQTTVITGNRVDFGKVFSGLDSVGMLIRVSNVPEGFAPTVTVKTAGGQEKVLAKAAIPGAPLTLAYSGLDLFEAAPFQTLEFSQPLPEGAVVELVDANAPTALAEGFRGAFIGFRKRFEINNDQRVTTSDLALVLAWIQTSRGTDEVLIKARALEIFPAVSGSVATLPTTLGEDLDNNSVVDTKDVVLAMAWIQVGRLASDTLVYNRAREISPAVDRLPVVYPGLLLGTSIPNLLEIDLQGGVKMQFVALPTGTFNMGNGVGYLPVTITRPIWMSVTEVTQEQYTQVTGLINPSSNVGPKRPVETISWISAAQFCNYLSDNQGLTRCYTTVGTETFWVNKDANGYRLPTEAEWEFACRAGTNTVYHWGDNWSEDYCWNDANSYINGVRQTHDVGTRLPNRWGLFDMNGNVNEFCWDWVAAYPAGPVSDPTGPASAASAYAAQYRELRGGSFVSNFVWNSSGAEGVYRGGVNPTSSWYDYGIRVVRNRP